MRIARKALQLLAIFVLAPTVLYAQGNCTNCYYDLAPMTGHGPAGQDAEALGLAGNVCYSGNTTTSDTRRLITVR
jgi:hypothetical protein